MRTQNAFQSRAGLQLKRFAVHAALLLALCGRSARSQDLSRDLQTAVRYIQEQNFAQAGQILRRITSQYPENGDSQFLLGIVLTQENKLDEANRFFARARELNKNLHVALRAQAMNEFALAQTDAAEAHFRQFLEKAPDDEVSHAFLARMAFARGKNDEALQLLKKAPSLLKTDHQLKLLLGEIYLKQGRKPEARSIIDSMEGDDPQLAFQMGLLFSKYGLYPEAIPRFGRTVSALPDFVPGRYNLALAYFQTDRPQEARELLEALVKNNQADFDVLNLLADVYVKTDQVNDSLRIRKETLRLYPGEENGYMTLAVISANIMDYDLGLEMINKGLVQLPHSVHLLTLRAWLHALKGQSSEAEADYQEALRLEPKNDWIRVGLAAVLVDGRRSREALPILQKLIDQGMDNYFVYHLFGEASMQVGGVQGTPREARVMEALQKSIVLEPSFVPPRLHLAKLYRSRGEDEKALAQLEKIVALEPDKAAAYYQLAQIYQEKNQLDEARKMLETVQRLNQNQNLEEQQRASNLSGLSSIVKKAIMEN